MSKTMWVCHLGHEFDEPEADFKLTISSGNLEHKVGRLCITCLAAFLSKNFGLVEKIG